MTGSTRKDKCLSEKEMEMLLDHADRSSPVKIRNTVALHLLAGTGLKLREATDLLVSEINTATGFLTAGRNARRRDLPMDERTVPLMQAYISEYRSRFILQRSGYKCEVDNVLLSYKLKPLPRHSFRVLVKAIGEESGLEINPEIIRHSFIYHLWKKHPYGMVFFQRTGIAGGAVGQLDLPEAEMSLTEALRKYHPRF